LAIAFDSLVNILGFLRRTSNHKILHIIVLADVEVIRNTPYLIQLFFTFFSLPNIGIKLPIEQAEFFPFSGSFGAYFI